MKKRRKILLWASLGLILLIVGGFYLYVSDYYRADETALAVLDSEGVEQVSEHLIAIHPDAESDSDTALIFYPGAKVEYTAYLPILKAIAEEADITVFLTKMPFNMAIFAADRAADVMAAYPDIEHWYIGGHSMGGAMAGSFAEKKEDELEGMILLGAYIYGDFPPAQTLTVYGSLNTSVEEKIDYEENIVVIEGGNHAQFGNYGEQRGDAAADISQSDQQQQAVDAIVEFIQSNK